MKRKIIQISVSCNSIDHGNVIIALCDDGTLWRTEACEDMQLSNCPSWTQIKDVQQSKLDSITTTPNGPEHSL